MTESTTSIQENTGTFVNNPEITNAGQVSMGDITNNVYADAPVQFTEVVLEGYLERYVAPTIETEVLEQLRRSRVLILSGAPNFDTDDFASYLAAMLQVDSPDLKAYQLQQNINSESLIPYLKQKDARNFFLLSNISPQHVGHNFTKLLEGARTGDHYIVITTNLRPSDWMLNDVLTNIHWRELPNKIEYSARVLGSLLIEELSPHKSKLPDRPVSLNLDTLLAEEFTISDAGSGLSSPSQVSLFIHYYTQQERSPSPDMIREFLSLMSDEKELFAQRWFHGLTHEQKLITVSAALLEGLFDDQFFSAVSNIVKAGFWEASVPRLKVLDYCDVTFLMSLFRFEKVRDGYQLRCTDYDFRNEIIKIAWSTHRRHMKAVFPALLTMVVESYQRDAKNWELYGTSERRTLYRHTFGAMLTELSFAAYDPAEVMLLELAASGNYYYQIIAARSMATWRDLGEHEKLFTTLQNWQTDEWVRARVTTFLQRREPNIPRANNSENPEVYVKSTAILVLKYASQYDSANKLREPLIDCLKQFIQDADPLVFDRVKSVLPDIIKKHYKQLKDILMEEFMLYSHLADPISEGLIKAYESYPHDVKASLKHWLSVCLETTSKENRRQMFTQRDNVVDCILATYGKIGYTFSEADVITVEEVFEDLEKLLKQEGRQALRYACMQLLVDLQIQDFQYTFAYVTKIVATLSDDDLALLLECWNVIYLSQRQNLEGATHLFDSAGESYPTWVKMSHRPLTSVEEGLFHWLTLPDLKLQELATFAFLNFARTLDGIEWGQIQANTIKDVLRPAPPARDSVPEASSYEHVPSYPTQKGELGFWTKVRLFFFFLFKDDSQKPLLKHLILLLRNDTRYGKADHNLLQWKWASMGNPTAKTLGKWLKRFV
jgi:hypothetical protein